MKKQILFLLFLTIKLYSAEENITKYEDNKYFTVTNLTDNNISITLQPQEKVEAVQDTLISPYDTTTISLNDETLDEEAETGYKIIAYNSKAKTFIVKDIEEEMDSQIYTIFEEDEEVASDEDSKFESSNQEFDRSQKPSGFLIIPGKNHVITKENNHFNAEINQD